MDPGAYLSRTGLAVPERAVRDAQTKLWEVLEEARKASIPATPHALSRLYSYKVPKLSDDGSCSLVNELSPTPYDLTDALGGRGMRSTLSLMVLNGFLDSAQQHSGLDWLGIYQARARGAGRALVKLASRGVPSRAEFPLTEAFSAKSNNVAVALSGQPRVIADVKAHLEAGGASYECDPKVRSEACLPIFARDGSVVGVVDAEHSVANAFDEAHLGWVVALACEAPQHLPG